MHIFTAWRTIPDDTVKRQVPICIFENGVLKVSFLFFFLERYTLITKLLLIFRQQKLHTPSSFLLIYLKSQKS